jgi:hypothetical protein
MSEQYLGVKATLAAFDKANGNEFVAVDGMLYFKNGARRERNPWGALYEPPKNEHRRLKVVEAYWEELLSRAVDEFASAKEDYLSTAKANSQCGFGAPDVKEAKQTLVKLQERVRLCERKLSRTRDKMLETPEGQRQIQREADMAECQAENEGFVQSIRKIKI